MLCPTCPKRATCKSPCEALEKELARIERPLKEVLVPEKKLTAISDSITAKEFFQTQFDAEEEHLIREREEERKRLFKAVNDALEDLTPRQRECVKLRYWEDLAPEEIAMELGITRQGVLHHLELAQKKIKKCLTASLKTGCKNALID